MKNNYLQQRARAFDHIFDAVVVTDLDGTIIDWNGGAEALYGYSSDQAIGQPVHILHVPEDIEKLTAEVLSTVEKYGKWKGEVRMLHQDGSIGWIESIVIPLLDEDGNPSGALGINRDISQRVFDKEKLARLAMTDSLTGLPNRHLFFDRLNQLLACSDRTGQHFALLFLDLDDFKQVNDSHGHLTGDEVLRQVASLLAGVLGKCDTIARVGGDEFAVLLEKVDNREEAINVAEKLIAEVDTTITVDGKTARVNTSIGIVIYPGDGSDSDSLMTAADHAMYRAKQRGGGCYETVS